MAKRRVCSMATCSSEIYLRLRKLRKRLSQVRKECRRLRGQTFSRGQKSPHSGTDLPWPEYAIGKFERDIAVFERAFASIPGNVTEQVQLFPERQFSLLSLASRCDGALDLIQSTPALALMLANSWVFRGQACPAPAPLRPKPSVQEANENPGVAGLASGRPTDGQNTEKTPQSPMRRQDAPLSQKRSLDRSKPGSSLPTCLA